MATPFDTGRLIEVDPVSHKAQQNASVYPMDSHRLCQSMQSFCLSAGIKLIAFNVNYRFPLIFLGLAAAD